MDKEQLEKVLDALEYASTEIKLLEMYLHRSTASAQVVLHKIQTAWDIVAKELCIEELK
jgi:hypothetical protein